MHTPVLIKEVLQYLDVQPNENFVDCTANGGGHTKAIMEKGGKVLAIEWDKDIFKNLNSTISVNDSYINLKNIVKENNFDHISGILFDLGMSSQQLENSGRGFTFQKDELLDMRYSTNNSLTAEYIVNNWAESELIKILKEYGEERFAQKIARNIIRQRPIKTTFQLVRAIGGKRGRIHPATRTFQALRIAVNNELDSLKRVLPDAGDILAQGGKLIVISFHSLEDRIVKNFFKNSNLNILTKKPIIASSEEIKNNPRARSAKLRAGVKK